MSTDQLQQEIYLIDSTYPGLISQLISLLEPDLSRIKQENSSEFLRLSNIYGNEVIKNILSLLTSLSSSIDITDYSNNNRYTYNTTNINSLSSTSNIINNTKPITELIYKPITNINYVKTKVSNSCWSNTENNIISFYTSSLQHNKNFFINVYNENPDITDNELVQFSVAYGNYSGLGSSKIDSGSIDNSFTPTKVIYSQYKNVLGGQNNNKFVIDGTAINDIFIVNINRNRLKQSIDINNWELTLNGSNGNMYSFIDDSTISTNLFQQHDIKVYNIVSGSITNGIKSTDIYGLIYPEFGVLLFNAKKLNEDGIVIITNNINTNDNNHYTFLNSISGGNNFLMRNEQELSTVYYTVDINHNEYNYSMNPSFVTGSLGEFKNTSFITDPYTFPTTIGLYNDNYELLAIAKLPKPNKKDFYNEMSFYVKLDF